jgi:hypothetical protein
VTPPAPAVLNQVRTSDDFEALRDNARFQAIVAKLMPCSGPKYKELDFWLGDWEVHTAAGQLLGHNRITKRHGSCVVVEEWESAGGGIRNGAVVLTSHPDTLPSIGLTASCGARTRRRLATDLRELC